VYIQSWCDTLTILLRAVCPAAQEAAQATGTRASVRFLVSPTTTKVGSAHIVKDAFTKAILAVDTTDWRLVTLYAPEVEINLERGPHLTASFLRHFETFQSVYTSPFELVVLSRLDIRLVCDAVRLGEFVSSCIAECKLGVPFDIDTAKDAGVFCQERGLCDLICK
jgi:hypothetical protein